MATGRTTTERVLEAMAAAGVVALVVYAFVVWPSLPPRVPIHFGFSGPPTSWAGRGALAILPGAAVFAYLAATISQRFPRAYNFPVPVTPANADRLYTLARRLATSVKLVMTAIFGYLFWLCAAIARGEATGLPAWFFPTVIVVVSSLIITTYARMKRC
jgi:uncharacterized membrane protein